MHNFTQTPLVSFWETLGHFFVALVYTYVCNRIRETEI